MSWLVPADGWLVGGACMYIVCISIWITKKEETLVDEHLIRQKVSTCSRTDLRFYKQDMEHFTTFENIYLYIFDSDRPKHNIQPSYPQRFLVTPSLTTTHKARVRSCTSIPSFSVA